MKTVQVRALLLDALHQVLDNKVFRILMVLALLPPLLTLLVHFKQDDVVLFFGWKRLGYESFSWLIGSGNLSEAQAIVIDYLVSIVFDHITGTVGVLICLIATAFFVPQMIEKGAADILFHKPLTRFTLYLWRYFAGLLFVALLALVMSLGTYVGLTIFSGYSDPGILASVFTLTYGFGMLYAVSMLFGVITKNAVGSILCTLIFMFVNGCIVQEAWVFKESWAEVEAVELAEKADAPEVDVDGSSGILDPFDTINPWWRRSAVVADVLHYSLPMTRDAKLIGRELRRAANTLPYQDRDTGVSFFRLPDEAESWTPEEGSVPDHIEANFGPARFGLRFPTKDARLSLHRRPRSTEVEDGNESSRDVAKELVASLGADAHRSSATIGTSARGRATATNVVTWTRGERTSKALLFRAGDFIYAIHVDLPQAISEEEEEDLRHRIDSDFGIHSDGQGGGPRWGQWYEKRVGFDAPLPYNLSFSMLRSALFVILVLLFGWWRLSRMDF